MKKRITAFKIIAIIISIITALLLIFGVSLHIIDLIRMKECLADPDCHIGVLGGMIIAIICYFICFIMLNIDAVFIILYFTIKKHNNESINI